MPFSSVYRWVIKLNEDTRPVTSAPNSCSINLQKVQRLLKFNLNKIRRRIYFSANCRHGWNFKSICIAILVNYFASKEGKH